MIVEKKHIVRNFQKADMVLDLRKLEFWLFPVKAKPKASGDSEKKDEEGNKEEVAPLGNPSYPKQSFLYLDCLWISCQSSYPGWAPLSFKSQQPAILLNNWLSTQPIAVLEYLLQSILVKILLLSLHLPDTMSWKMPKLNME